MNRLVLTGIYVDSKLFSADFKQIGEKKRKYRINMVLRYLLIHQTNHFSSDISFKYRATIMYINIK